MRVKEQIKIYQSIKSEYMSDFNLVLSSKSQMCDLIVLGIQEDIFIKIIYPDNNINLDNLINRVKNKSIWRNLIKSVYIFYIYDENYKLSKKLKIDL